MIEQETQAVAAATLEALLAAAPVGLALVDRELRLLWTNQVLAALGPAFGTTVAPLVRRVIDEGEGLVAEEVEVPAADVSTTLDAQPRTWLIHGYPVATPTGPAVGLAAIDITAQRLALRQASADRARLQQVFQQLPIAVVVAEAPSERVLLANPLARELMPLSSTPLEGGDEIARLPLLHPDGTPFRVEEMPLVRALRGGEVVTDEELACVGPDGATRLLRCSAGPVRDADGRIVVGVTTFRDITGRRQAEEQLREREAQLRDLIEDVDDYSIYLLDARGRVASWNRGAERNIGYPAAEVIGRSISVFYPQEDVLLGKPEQALAVAQENGRFREEGWRLRKDGSRFWATVAITALRRPNGTLRGFATIVRDITERKLSEEVLRASNRRIASTLESISDAFCAIDREWRFTFVNPEAERLLGKRRPDLIGRALLDAFPELGDTEFRREFQRAMAEGKKLDFEEYFAPRLTWFEVRAYPSDIGLSIYFRDITERRRAATAERVLARTGKQLAESLDYQATLDEIASLAVPDLADWCIAVMQDGGRTPLGGSAAPPPARARHYTFAHADGASQASGRALFGEHPFGFDTPDGFGAVLRSSSAMLLSDIPDAFMQAIAPTEAQAERLRLLPLVSAMAVPLRARGRTLGAMAFVSTTPRRRYGRADLALAEEVGRRAALAVDNALLYREAQQAIRAREDMVAIATHDLRGPVSALKLATHLVREHVRATPPGAPPPAGLGAELERIERQVERLAGLVTFFLEVSRVAAGQLDLKLQPVDAALLVHEAVARFRDQLEEAGCAVAIRADRPIVGRWDRMRLEQVVNNLLANAIKFGKGQPIEVSVATDDDHGDGMASLSVTDHGVGIPREEHTRIFERFRRTPAGEAYTGVGLGLYIVKMIVQALGGTIAVASEAGQGATFTVRLPRGGTP